MSSPRSAAPENPLHRRLRQQAFVAELGQRALERTEFGALAELAVEGVASGLGVGFASVLEVADGGAGLRVIARRGWRPGSIVIPADSGSQAGFTLSHRAPVLVDDYATETRFGMPAVAREHDVHSGISVLIGGLERPFGVLAAHHRAPMRFSGDDVAFMQSVANVLGAAVQRARDEEALQQSEERYRSVMQHVSDAIFVCDGEGRYLEANVRGRAMLGYSPEELERMTAHDLLVLQPGEMPARLAELRAGKSVLSRRRLRRADGTALPVEIHANVLPDGRLLAAVRDASERESAEQALRDASERFRQALRASHAGAWEWDLENDRVVWSEESFELVGLQPGAVEPSLSLWLDMVHSDDREGVKQHIEASIAGHGDLDVECRLQRADGEERWMHVAGSLVCDAVGKPVRVYGVQRDVTERRLAERARIDAEERYRASQKMEAIGRLAGGVAHDFNNLLTSIIGYTELAMVGLAEGDERREDLTEVLRAADTAKELTRRLLAVARRRPVSSMVVEFGAGLRDLETLLRHTLGEDVTVAMRLPATPLFVRVDRGQLAQLLLNLCGNARDAMPRGGTITIQLGSEPASAADELGWAHLQVIDTGIGVPPDAVERVFEPFFTTKGELGSGLGLATCYGIVKQFGGEIRLRSAVDEGTCVDIWLPLVPAPEPHALQKSRSRPPWRPNGPVLVVEDRASIREMMSRTLTGIGLQVVAAGTAEGALALVRGRERTLELLISDVVLPGRSGIELAQALRRQAADLRVLLVSGFTGAASHAPFQSESDRDAFLAKPFSSRDLLDALEREFGLVLEG